jgi:hypothetical protein
MDRNGGRSKVRDEEGVIASARGRVHVGPLQLGEEVAVIFLFRAAHVR